ncbi:hypothetical protein [Streptomyces sp. NPDC096339]|uniref:RCC1 domain-containing protein n=1 Tax=Streptomyces sp. NPDC096339 TaxID=3366086 RepID=UPI00382C4793
MGFAKCGRSARRRAAAAGLVALLWGALPLSGWSAANADSGRAAEPGIALAWGDNGGGQLGDGSTVGQSTTPVRVCGDPPCTSPLDRVLAIAGGSFHSLALRADGTVWAWGVNSNAQLGDGTKTASTTPVQVCAVGETAPCDTFLTGVKAIAAGVDHSVALRANGTVVAWGFNGEGQLGDGTTTDRRTPVQVCAVGGIAPCAGFLSGVKGIAAGRNHNLAVRTDGRAYAWGRNAHGQLGNGMSGNDVQSSVPVEVTDLTNVTGVAAGGEHSLAVLTDGTVRTWGYNVFGQLGNGADADSSTPVVVCAPGQTNCTANPLTGVRSLAAGEGHSLAALTDGTVRSWGFNGSGQLGNGTNTATSLPVQVCATGQTAPCTSFQTGITNIAAGGVYSLALRADGGVQSWGSNNSGQLGNGRSGPGTGTNAPVRVCASGQTAPCSRFLDGVGAIAAAGLHSLAVARPLADVAVDISATPDSVRSGSNLTYTVTVRNIGSTRAENIVLNDTLPPGARFVSATPAQGSCTVPTPGSSDTVTCRVGVLGSGEQVTTQIVVRVVTAAGSTVTDWATVSSTTPDPNEVNNSVSIDTSVR